MHALEFGAWANMVIWLALTSISRYAIYAAGVRRVNAVRSAAPTDPSVVLR
jgi:hypothetical protein